MLENNEIGGKGKQQTKQTNKTQKNKPKPKQNHTTPTTWSRKE